MTGIEFFLTFTAGFWLAHWAAVAFILLAAAGIFAVAVLALLLTDGTREERELDARDRETIAVFAAMPREHGIAHEPGRVLAPAGFGGNDWVPPETSRHGTGPTPPTGQPGRGGHKTLTLASTSLDVRAEPPGAADCGTLPPAAPGPELPENVTKQFDAAWAIAAEIGRQETDAERWPDLMPGQGYSDETDTFRAICADVMDGA